MGVCGHCEQQSCARKSGQTNPSLLELVVVLDGNLVHFVELLEILIAAESKPPRLGVELAHSPTSSSMSALCFFRSARASSKLGDSQYVSWSSMISWSERGGVVLSGMAEQLFTFK